MSHPADRFPHAFGASDASDSAGVPWAGRRFEPNAAATDDGAADPALAAALARFAAAEASAAEVVDALRAARLLVPLMAHAGEVGDTPDGRTVDKTQELSIVTVAAPDGRRALPAFSSVDAMRSWNPAARPVPAAAPRVALAAASEGTDLIVLDPGTSGFVLRRPAVRALATASPWVPPHDDPQVQEAFEASVADDPDALSVSLEAGDPRCILAAEELLVRLALRPGLDRTALAEALRRLGERWATDQRIAEHVDSLKVSLMSAGYS